jgi:selenocysteine-specific elongation factor
VHLHLGAEDILGRVALLEGEQLGAGRSHAGRDPPRQADGALHGDRFILRDQSAQRTLGGGRVLDIFPPTRHKRAAERLAYLRLLEQDDPAPALKHALARQPAGADLDRFALNRNLAPEEAEKRCGAAWPSSVGERRRPQGLLRRRLAGPARAPARSGAPEHERAPDMIGVERDRLRRLTLPTLSRAVFDRLTFELLADGELAQSGSWLHLPEHRAALSRHRRRPVAHAASRCWRRRPATRRACATSPAPPASPRRPCAG